MDACGFPKDDYFYYRTWWNSEPMLHLFPHWNWRNGETVKVWCHSNLDRVELFLNGASLGARDVVPCNHVEWDVVFAPGTIEARGYRGGSVVLVEKRETAGAAARIRLSADRPALAADGEDVAMVAVAIVDAQGRAVPDADNLVLFDMAGSGAVIGVGNGDPRCIEPDKASQRSAFNGMCLAVVQATKTPGTITLRATADGLQPATLVIPANAATARAFVP
jgi:beta-galactosidase